MAMISWYVVTSHEVVCGKLHLLAVTCPQYNVNPSAAVYCVTVFGIGMSQVHYVC